MNNIYHDIVIDLAHMGFPESVSVKQYDDQIPHVRVELLKNGVKYVIPSGTTLRMQGTKPDGTHFMHDVTRTEDGRIDCPLSEQILAAAGPTLAEVQMTDATGTLSTFNFCIQVQQAALHRSDIVSSNDYQSIDKIKADTLQYKTDAEAAAIRSEAAKNAADGSAATATQQAQTAQLEAQKVQQIVAGNEAYTKTESDLKYTVAPRKEASSDTGELKLTDADEGLAYLELQGNSEQYTNTANKNLFDTEYQKLYGINYNSFLKSNGEVDTGPSANAWRVSYYIKVKPSTTYTYTDLPTSTMANVVFYSQEKTFISAFTNAVILQNGGIVTVPSNGEFMRVSFVELTRNTFQIEEEQTATAYIQGTIDTPSPDYPSEVRSVGDIPKDVNGVEIRNILDEEYLKNPDNWSTQDRNLYYVKLSPSTVNLSGGGYKMSNLSFAWQSVLYLSEMLTAGANVRIILINNAGDVQSGSYTFSSTDPIYLIAYNRNGDITTKTQFIDELFRCYKLMVTEADEIDEYRPYIGENNGLIKLESNGINVLNTKVISESANNINVTLSKDGSEIYAKQNITDNVSFVHFNFKYEANKIYTVYCKTKLSIISGSGGGTIIGIRDKSMKEGAIFNAYVENPEQEIMFKFNTSDKKNLGFLVYVQSNSQTSLRTLMVMDPMIVEGEKTLQEMRALKYQPYHQQITWIPLKEPLRAMKTDYNVFGDTVDKQGNVTKKIMKMKMSEVLNLNNGWGADPSGINARSSDIKFAYYTMDNIYKPANNNKDIPCLCEKLKYSKNGTSPTVESIWHSSVIVFQIKNIRTGLSDTEMDTIVIAKAIRDYIKVSDYVVYYLLSDVNFYNYKIPAVYIETHDPETNVRSLNKVKPSDMTLDYKIAMSSLIKRLEALETNTVQEV